MMRLAVSAADPAEGVASCGLSEACGGIDAAADLPPSLPADWVADCADGSAAEILAVGELASLAPLAGAVEAWEGDAEATDAEADVDGVKAVDDDADGADAAKVVAAEVGTAAGTVVGAGGVAAATESSSFLAPG